MKTQLNKIFIYGVPGVGKTRFSKILGNQLHIPVIEGDKIKSRARKTKSRREHPFLFLGTCLAYKEYGELNQENAIKGLLAVRNALELAVMNEVQNWQELILEAAFLNPQSLIAFGRPILLVVSEEAKHKKQFLTHREKLLDFQNNEFKAARMIQEYLIKEAKKLGIEINTSN